MEVLGMIRERPNGPTMTRKAWCDLIPGFDTLVPPESRTVTNPFTKKPALVKPTEDTVNIVIDGQVVGQAYWSQSEDNEIVFCGDAKMVPPIVREIALILDGQFETIL
jgi:hypothetical protein